MQAVDDQQSNAANENSRKGCKLFNNKLRKAKPIAAARRVRRVLYIPALFLSNHSNALSLSLSLSTCAAVRF